MHASSSSSLSLSTLFQYGFFGIVLYVLAGAPLLSILGLSGTSSLAGNGATYQGMSAAKLDNLVFPEKDLECKEHGFKGVYVLSREPLVVYIEGFLSEEESEELVEMSEPHFTPSTIWTAGQETLDPTIRSSEKAPLPRTNTTKCIEDRARRFQGWRPHVFIEKLWTQRYRTGGHYTYHYDWSTATRSAGRISSFMVYLQADCTGGGTHFPRLQRPVGGEWCRFIECDAGGNGTVDGQGESSVDLSAGVVFKPVRGNAVYWENMRADGSGYEESWHAGLPVKSGVKIGLNIWSWFQDGYVWEEESEAGKEG